jgi:Sulfotransferase domain
MKRPCQRQIPGFDTPGPAHHRGGAAALPGRRNDPCLPSVLQRTIPVGYNRVEPSTTGVAHSDLEPLAHRHGLPSPSHLESIVGPDPLQENEVTSSLKIDFIGIGAPKCGTTWLFYALGQHPDICLSEPKEPRYFSRADFCNPCRSNKDEPISVDGDDIKDLGSYAKHYTHCVPNSIKGEFSTDYMYNEEAPSRIHRYLPDVKLLVCIRNPVDWAYSWYFAQRHYYKETEHRTFEDQLKNDSGFLDIGCYAKYLKHYLQYFPKNQIRIIQFEHIVERPERTVRDLFEFLTIDPEVALNLSLIPRNSTKKSRFVSPVPLMKWFSTWMIEHDQATLLRKIRNMPIENLILRLTTADCPREPMNQQTRERLRRFYSEDIDELESLFELDLAAWK